MNMKKHDIKGTNQSQFNCRHLAWSAEKDFHANDLKGGKEMKNHKSIIAVVFILLVSSYLFAQDDYSLDYAKKSHQFQRDYGISFSVKFLGVNRLDYKYKIDIEAEQPSPEEPSPIGPKGTPGGQLGENLKKNIIEYFNKMFLERLGIFGQDKIQEWYKKLNDINENSAEINKIIGIAKEYVWKIAIKTVKRH